MSFILLFIFFFFKQKTAYEMRISDWSSDVCSSDLHHAWSLVTKEWGISPDRLTVTVYHDDEEAFEFWRKIAGLPGERIIRIATSDNFWSMGDTGPCGPCSEIFYAHGAHIPGGPPGSSAEDRRSEYHPGGKDCVHTLKTLWA